MSTKITSASSPEFARAWQNYIQTEDENGINAVQRFVYDLVTEVTLANGQNQNSRVVDFGCGTGTFFKECSRRGHPMKNYYGFDINPDLIKQCQNEALENAKFAVLDTGCSASVSQLDDSMDIDLVVLIRLLNYLSDEQVKWFLEFIIQKFRTSVFVIALPIERSVQLQPSDKLSAIPCKLEFEGIAETQYLRHITQYEATLRKLGVSVVRVKSVDLREAGEPTHCATYGIL